MGWARFRVDIWLFFVLSLFPVSYEYLFTITGQVPFIIELKSDFDPFGSGMWSPRIFVSQYKTNWRNSVDFKFQSWMNQNLIQYFTFLFLSDTKFLAPTLAVADIEIF